MVGKERDFKVCGSAVEANGDAIALLRALHQVLGDGSRLPWREA